MKSIKLSYLLVITALIVLWALADKALWSGYEFFALRRSLVHGTGILAIGVMSVGMILAVRPISIEPFLGGLDKSYRLHKWLGVTGLVLAIIHWLWLKVPKWMVGWGWLERPERRPHAEQELAIFKFFQSQ